MSKIRKYGDFISEELFGNLFGGGKKKKVTAKKTRIESCVENILNFLKENQIEDWNDFVNMKPFDREIIDKLIDSEVNSMDELKEVKFELKLRLSDKKQLRSMIKEYEELEEYEKCAKIVKKLSEM